MSRPWDWVLKAVATAALGGGLAWGSYLTGQVDTLKETDTDHAKKIAVTETNYAHIASALDRIERKLEVKK